MKIKEDQKKTLLVIDDEPIILDTCYIMFAGVYDVMLENSYYNCEDHLKNHIDYIMVDYMMPDIDGISVIKKIMENENQKKSKIILQTACSDNEIINIASKLKVDILRKPYNRKMAMEILEGKEGKSY